MAGTQPEADEEEKRVRRGTAADLPKEVFRRGMRACSCHLHASRSPARGKQPRCVVWLWREPASFALQRRRRPSSSGTSSIAVRAARRASWVRLSTGAEGGCTAGKTQGRACAACAGLSAGSLTPSQLCARAARRLC